MVFLTSRVDAHVLPELLGGFECPNHVFLSHSNYFRGDGDRAGGQVSGVGGWSWCGPLQKGTAR